MARITIIIPSYNHQDFIEQRLDTILNQTNKDWEAIIIDDASSDDSLNIIDSYLKAHPQFKVKEYIKNKENSGSGYRSWEKGIALAETEFIWIAETDDFSDLNFLETTFTALESNTNAALVFTASNYVNSQGEFLYNTNKRFAKLNLKEDESDVFNSTLILDDLPLDPLITNGSSVLFRKPKSLIPEVIFENKQLSDLFLWTYLLKDKHFICINNPLNYFRRHEDSTTAKNFKKKNAKIYYEYLTYALFFQLDKLNFEKIFNHYIRRYLIPNRKSIGYFNTTPFKDLKHLTFITRLRFIFKGYLNHLLKKR